MDYPERWYDGEPLPRGGYYWVDGAGNETWILDGRAMRPNCTYCLDTYWYMYVDESISTEDGNVKKLAEGSGKQQRKQACPRPCM